MQRMISKIDYQYWALQAMSMTDDYFHRMAFVEHQKNPNLITKMREFDNGYCYLMLLTREDKFCFYELLNLKLSETYFESWDKLYEQLDYTLSVRRRRAKEVLGEHFVSLNCFQSPSITPETNKKASNIDGIVSLRNVDEVEFLTVPRNYQQIIDSSIIKNPESLDEYLEKHDYSFGYEKNFFDYNAVLDKMKLTDERMVL